MGGANPDFSPHESGGTVCPQNPRRGSTRVAGGNAPGTKAPSHSRFDPERVVQIGHVGQERHLCDPFGVGVSWGCPVSGGAAPG